MIPKLPITCDVSVAFSVTTLPPVTFSSPKTNETTQGTVSAVKRVKEDDSSPIFMAIGVVASVLLLGIIVCVGMWRHHNSKKAKPSAYYDNRTDSGSVQFRPQALSSTSSSYLGSSAPLLRQRSYRSRLGSNLTQLSEFEMPLDEDWEIDRSHINILGELGEGAFGKVMKAEALGLPGLQARFFVAVKMLKGMKATPRKYAFLPCGHLDFESAIAAQKTNSRAILIARIHAC